MLTYFICPDGQRHKIVDCVKTNGCRLGRRCLTLPTLMELSKVRPWKGIPSTTQLIKGTYEAMLNIVIDTAEEPCMMMYRLLGTKVHAALEDKDVPTALIEERLDSEDGTSGAIDLYDTEGGWNVLTDHKTCHPYKASKAMGMYCEVKDHPTDVYKQKTYITVNGERITRLKGEPKVLKVWKQDFRKQDCNDWIYQLNDYRMKLEEKGFKVDELQIEAICKFTDDNLGITKQGYLISIPKLDDEVVRKYFTRKKNNLLKALEQGDWDEKCSDEETWNGRKCEKYCIVRDHCKFMQMGNAQEHDEPQQD